MEKILGVIFDLDGVIVSTDEYHYAAWKQLADREGIHFDRAINNRLRGVSRRESLMIILESSQRDYTEDEIEAMLKHKNDMYRKSLADLTESEVLPGVKDTINYLKNRGIKVAIGSSSKNTPYILKGINMADEFEVIVDGSMIENSKPDPEVFLKGALGLGLAPENCLVVEDAMAGVEAALRANMRVLGVGDASGSLEADFRADGIQGNTMIDIIKLYS